ncbi:MAG TPA: hypothetical protein VMJ34_12425 [Bryobacteraceae bacterium]|nr:hypothetical protein [Bryobacteraceae bacterium]
MDISECQEALAAVTEAHAILLDTLDESLVDAAEPGAALLAHRRLQRLRPRIDAAVAAGDVKVMGPYAGEARKATLRFHDEATKAVERARLELENTSLALRDVLSTLAKREGSNAADVERELDELESLLKLPDPQQMREALQTGLLRLRQDFEKVQREKDSMIATLRDELRTLQRSVEKAVERPTGQGFSSMLPREEFEAFVELEIERGAAFCLVYAGVANLSRIERFHGPVVAEAAAEAFVGQLRDTLRNTVAVAQLSTSQFCCLETCSYDEAIRQVHLVTKALEKAASTRDMLTPRFMTVMFTPADGADRLRKKFFDLQRQNQ